MTAETKPRLILHIGAPKTGSSAIQVALALSARALREHGIVVPDTHLGTTGSVEGHQVFEFDSNRSDPQGPVNAIRTLAREPQVRAVVVSAENLIESGRVYAEPMASLSNTYDISIHAYVRNQDDFIASAWQQWFCKVHSDFWAWLISDLGNIGNWWKMLDPWLRVFGQERIKLGLYTRDAPAAKDAPRDFFEMAGLPIEALASERKLSINPSYSRAVQFLVEGNPGLFESPHDNDFYQAVHSLLGDSAVKRAGEHLFTTAQRAAILRHYKPANEALRRTFFPDTPSPLFKNPAAAPGEGPKRRTVTVEELREEVDLLTRLFYAEHRARRGK
jgi:hypothetical protein